MALSTGYYPEIDTQITQLTDYLAQLDRLEKYLNKLIQKEEKKTQNDHLSSWTRMVIIIRPHKNVATF